MEVICFLIAIILIGYVVYNAAYTAGKREGSRKGYGVGYSRGRRRGGQSGCLLVILVGSLLLTAATVAIASLR